MQMKPRQLFELSTAADRALASGICRVRAAWPTLAAVTVALASSVVLTLGG